MIEDRWSSQIDDITMAFRTTFGRLSSDELNWKPNTRTWSIAQNLDHLIVINNTYYGRIGELRNDTLQLPAISRVGFIVKMFGKLILNAVQPDRKRKTKTFDIWEPSQTLIDSGIIKRFEID